MKILLICNNLNCMEDGIGMAGYYLSKALQDQPAVEALYTETAYTWKKGRWGKLLSFQMSRVFGRIKRYIGKVDTVIVEYPFVEHNPYIVLAYRKLSRVCRKYNIRLVLSLHEYFRVKALRQRVIEQMVAKSDILLTTDDKTEMFFKEKHPAIIYGRREVPSNIVAPSGADLDFTKKDPLCFVYFGLVNGAKAFDEMVEAWKLFNPSGKFSLDIVTSSSLTMDEGENQKYNIHLRPGLDNDAVADILERAAFMVVPIRPKVELNSGTFKAGLMFGCIGIGLFAEVYNGCDFIIPILSYQPEALAQGYARAAALEGGERGTMFRDSQAFGQRFSIQNSARMVIDAIQTDAQKRPERATARQE